MINLRKTTLYYNRILLLIILVACLLKFILKDHFSWSATLFYARPLFFLIPLSFLGLIFSYYSKYRSVNLVLFLLVSFLFTQQSFYYNSIDYLEKDSLKISYWNACHRRNFTDAFQITNTKPDLLILGEFSEDKVDLNLNKYLKKNPDYNFKILQNRIGIASKTKIENIKTYNLENESLVVHFQTKIAHKNYNIFTVDIGANPLYYRENIFKTLQKLTFQKENCILLGDFNTPDDSVFWSFLEPQLKNSFQESGNGFYPNWPFGIPLLATDHILTSKNLKSLKLTRFKSIKSDHQMLYLSLDKS